MPRSRDLATIPFNLLFGLFLGLTLAACARTQFLSGAVPWRNDMLLPVLSFSLLMVAPVSTYLYLAYPEWSWMYFYDVGKLPRGTGLAAIVLTTLTVPLGYLGGWLLLRLLPPAKAGRALFSILGALGMMLCLLCALLWRRFVTLGRTEDFAEAAARVQLLFRPITQGKVFYALLCIWPLVISAFALVALQLWGQGRWLRQQAAASVRSSEHRTRTSRPGTNA